MKIARVFPSKTKATPNDTLCFFSSPRAFFNPKVDEVHISVTFTWDLKRAELLEKQWSKVAPVKIGGPATGMKGEQFEPGIYLKPGYVITSRGCPNKCWFCSVWKREGTIRELEIKEGNNILDDNLLACSESHIRKVFAMLKTQKDVVFTGGLEAARLEEYQIDLIYDLNPLRMFFAYDTPDDYEPLQIISTKLKHFCSGHRLCAYVLIGYPKDTFEKAEYRLQQTKKLGIIPFAMLYKNERKSVDIKWKQFQRTWVRPEIIFGKPKNVRKGLLDL
jgi:hypothetical protein